MRKPLLLLSLLCFYYSFSVAQVIEIPHPLLRTSQECGGISHVDNIGTNEYINIFKSGDLKVGINYGYYVDAGKAHVKWIVENMCNHDVCLAFKATYVLSDSELVFQNNVLSSGGTCSEYCGKGYFKIQAGEVADNSFSSNFFFEDFTDSTEILSMSFNLVSMCDLTVNRAQKKSVASTEKKYNDYITKAEDAVLAEDYATAKQNYEEASKVKPDERYAKNQIIAISKKLPAPKQETAVSTENRGVANTTSLNAKPTKSNASSNSYASGGNNGNASGPSGNIIRPKSQDTKIKNSEENSTASIKYKRSSLYTMMVQDNGRQYANVISQTFIEAPLPEKFNDHDLSEKVIPLASRANEQYTIDMYLNTNAIAKSLVAKWFNRSEKGTFNMDVIAQRGNYNATVTDLKIAALSARGNAMLSDAGEELIGNTFVVINDFRYTNKEEVANKAKTGLALLSIASSLAGGPDLSSATTLASAGLTVAGKGYVIKNTSYLYRLVWNEEVAAEFYKEYWMDDASFSLAKKAAFENSNIFSLKYIGHESAFADLQSNAFTNKTEEELITRATVKAVDAGIAKLQRKFEQFRTKTPLYTANPPTAKIGLKEGLQPGDRFEVLEATQDEAGKINYVRKGVIKVDRDIWDNRFEVGEVQNASLLNQYTTFRGSGNFYPGMLIRQID